MCLLVVVSRAHADSPLLVAANRDEFLDRPATAMEVLQSAHPRILGGRDRMAGGTWLAVNEHGVVAALTNRPAASARDRSKRSRGELPLTLARCPDAAAAAEEASTRIRPSEYNAGSMLVADRSSLFYVDLTGTHRATVRELGAGVHLLENRELGEPSPKVDRVRELLGDLGGRGREDVSATLRRVLSDHEVPPSAGAESRPPELSAACVHTNFGYGTRWSALVDGGVDPPRLLYTDGPPCRSPVLDATPLWRRAVTRR